MSQENVEIVRRALDAYREGDFEGALALGHPEIVSTRVDPDGAVFHGHHGLRHIHSERARAYAAAGITGS